MTALGDYMPELPSTILTPMFSISESQIVLSSYSRHHLSNFTSNWFDFPYTHFWLYEGL